MAGWRSSAPLSRRTFVLYSSGMPRVSAEHLEGRRNQILDAARRCFAANGFHSTSMQDILAESGLSAGAVYRYFSGKEDIIAAIAERAMAAIRSALDDDASDRTLSEMVARALAAIDERSAVEVYRYFSGRKVTIAAFAERPMAAIRSALNDDASAPTLSGMVARALAAIDERSEVDDVGRLALQVWAEAARSDTLRERLAA